MPSFGGFGKEEDSRDVRRKIEDDESSEDEQDDDNEDSLFVVDTSKDENVVAQLNSDEEDTGDDEEPVEEQSNALKPVWEDEDDVNIDIDMTAVNRMRKLRKEESETTLTGKEYSRDCANFTANSAEKARSTGRALTKTLLTTMSHRSRPPRA